VLAARGVPQLWLGYKGTADLSREPLPPYSLLKPNQPVSGWIAITMLTLEENQAGYGWLTQYSRYSGSVNRSSCITSPDVATAGYLDYLLIT